MTVLSKPKILVTATQMLMERANLEDLWQTKAEISWAMPGSGRQQIDPDELARQVRGARALVVGDERIGDSVLAEANSLELIVKWGVGTDAIDKEALAHRSIRLRNTPGLFGEEVADLATGYLVMLTRNLMLVHEGVQNGEWPKPSARSVSSLNVAVIGCGAVGRTIIERLVGWAATVYAVDPDLDANSKANQLGAQIVSWSEALQAADVVILSRPAEDNGAPILTAAAIDLMRPGAYVINVARGSLVDESALAEALDSERLGGAALDTYVTEPLPQSSVLRSAPRVIFGSHNGSYTIDAIGRANLAVIKILESELAL
jgi:D-3-phosphoglycerate dehydrogenase